MGPWWLSQRIEDTVTRRFVEKHLLPGEIPLLDNPVGFSSETLTERTYLDSIQTNAKRLFLILADVGLPDQIFSIVDDGWDDDELPLSIEEVERLELTTVQDDKIDRRFFQRQFHYLVQPVERGEHKVYDDLELVPLEVVDRTPHLKSHQIEHIRLPNIPNQTFIRRKFSIGSDQSMNEFLHSIRILRPIQNQHLISYWASYTHRNSGYIILNPTSEFTLKSFLSSPPSFFKTLPKASRREIVINWILCLVDTICFLHSSNCSHTYIKPSTIYLTPQNHIFLADPTRLGYAAPTSHGNKASFDREWYDYAAPEQWQRPSGLGSPSAQQVMPDTFSISHDHHNSAQPRYANSAGPAAEYAQSPAAIQQADIFSLGCIILELLSYLLKRSGSKFASFRSAKHKQAGRGGAVLDTSFHRNLDQVEKWMSGLARDASKKASDADGAHVFRGYTPMLHIVARMLSANPFERPTSFHVQQQMYGILRDNCGIQEPHCVNRYAFPSSPSSPSSPSPPRRFSRGPTPTQDPRYYYQQSSGYYSQPHERSADSPSPILHRRSDSSGDYRHYVRTNSGGMSLGDVGEGVSAARGISWPIPNHS